jgi:hypothetical protein
MRRHLRLSAACGARVGAAESFVCFIPLFGRPARPPKDGWRVYVPHLLTATNIARYHATIPSAAKITQAKAGKRASP